MPTIKVNDINMYYEIYGDGEPLVLIGGLSNDVTDYRRIIPLLSKTFKVIAFDNRGAGRTDKPDIPYSIDMMASDTAGLLANLGIKETNVVGISLGGRVALQLALDQPKLVKKLVLVSTSARIVNTWQRFLMVNIISRLPLFKGKYPQPYYAFVHQKEAAKNYDRTTRLSEIHSPTLIMHGKKDSIAPYKLAEEMRVGIKEATMVTFNGGHLFPFFHPEQFVNEVVKFLKKQ